MSFSLPRLLSKLQSVITIDTANNDLRIANAVVFSDGTRQTTAGVATDSYARSTANLAFEQANTATGLAQAAFDSANNVFPQIQPAWNTANTAYQNTIYLEGVNNTQNTDISIIKGVNSWQNTQITEVNTYATAAFNRANNNTDHIALIEGVNLTQNTEIIAVNQYAGSAYAQANITIGVDATQNTRLSAVEFLAQFARDTANNAVANTNILAAVNATQNTRLDGVESTNSTQNIRLDSIETINTNQNTTIGIIEAVNLTQNTRLDGVEGVNLTQNTNITAVNQYAESAYSQANTNASDISVLQGVNLGQNTTITEVNQFAAGAYNKANNALPLAGGTVTGTILVGQDVYVSGNLYVSGNTTSVGANNITLSDSLIYLANENPANTVDIGIVGHFVQGKYQHTGVVRNHLNGNWVFFSNVSTEPTTTVNFAEANLVYDSIMTGGIVTPSATINGKDWQSVEDTQNTEIVAVNNYATAAYGLANTNATNITYVNQFAAAAYEKANAGISSSNTFITVNANSSLINATSNADVLTIMPGNNISFVTDTVGKVITINSNLGNVTVPTLAPYRTAFVAGSAQTSIAVTHTIPYVYVSINGITVDPSEYSANGTHVVLTTPLRTGDVVDVTGYTTGSATVPGIKGDKGDDYTSNTIMYVTDLFASGRVNVANTQLANVNGNLVVFGVSDVRAHTIDGGTLSLHEAVSQSVYANGVNITQNTRITAVEFEALYARETANSATANTIYNHSVNITQNTRITVIEGVDHTQNTNITIADTKAQAAFDKANTGLAATGGTLSGSLTINENLTVTGNLVVIGNSTSIAVSSLEIGDPLLYLAANNYFSDAVDIGFIGHYYDGANAHTGLIRDPNLKEYIFFKGYTPETEANNLINIAHPSFEQANVYASFFKGNTIANTVYATISVGVGTPASNVTGEIRAANNIISYYTSDRQYKENIVDIPDALNKVEAIGGKLFDWTDAYLNTHGGEDGYYVRKHDFGVIAQDVRAVFPVAVRDKPDGSLAVDYEKLSALAFAAIRELKKEIDELKGKK